MLLYVPGVTSNIALSLPSTNEPFVLMVLFPLLIFPDAELVKLFLNSTTTPEIDSYYPKSLTVSTLPESVEFSFGYTSYPMYIIPSGLLLSIFISASHVALLPLLSFT